MEQTVDVERLKRHLSELTWAPTVEISRAELLALLSRLERAEQAVQRVRELHQPVEIEPSETICHTCSTQRGAGQVLHYSPYIEYPCDTIRALDGDGRG